MNLGNIEGSEIQKLFNVGEKIQFMPENNPIIPDAKKFNAVVYMGKTDKAVYYGIFTDGIRVLIRITDDLIYHLKYPFQRINLTNEDTKRDIINSGLGDLITDKFREYDELLRRNGI